ncbi:hypothetical protein EIP91_001600 [Steccherinum ochraceum]|uniref:Uncharacterized protein n=1 Tax=Steccherinum ochraceum TaxID=92696 RepID=A0A4R0RDU1_9APHY|nr:hypothetical protein EIP91_001600 [Steccherinum ochraceum]
MTTKERKNEIKTNMWQYAMAEQAKFSDPNFSSTTWKETPLRGASLTPSSVLSLIDARATKEEGNTFYKAGKYRKAIAKYQSAMRVFLGKDATLPSLEYLNEGYLKLGDGVVDHMQVIELTACAGNVAQSYVKLYEASRDVEDLIALIDWTEEIRIIYECLKYSVMPEAPPWRRFHLNVIEYFTVPIKRFAGISAVFKELGNTSLAMMYITLASNYYVAAENVADASKAKALGNLLTDLFNLGKIRHPEPLLYAAMNITQPKLQIRGTWKKLEMTGRKAPGKSCLSCWIWNGRLYTAGGMNDVYMEQRDMWCLTLSTMKWKKLPDLPPLRPTAGLYTSRPMRIWNGKAYLFCGMQKIWVFDCATEKWSSLATKLQGSWPYPQNELFAYTSTILEGKLYVFGGDDSVTRLGTDIFMELDLETLHWRHISGSSGLSPHRSRPGLRVFTQLFAVPEQRKLYLCFGDANRSQAERCGHPAGHHTDYPYDDLWSYSLEAQAWKRERLRGNFPCLRAEHSAVYNPHLKRAIVHGGYNADMSSATRFTFSFYSDAYVFNPENGIWQQVITRGFPTYRAQSALVVDPDTGITYLYGGWTNSDYYPSKVILNRTFDDLWQLKLDTDGGYFEEEEYDIDTRSVAHGPWNQCFSCKKLDVSLKKCMGTCEGLVFFCSKTCQEKGWTEHKEAHGCRKRS